MKIMPNTSNKGIWILKEEPAGQPTKEGITGLQMLHIKMFRDLLSRFAKDGYDFVISKDTALCFFSSPSAYFSIADTFT